MVAKSNGEKKRLDLTILEKPFQDFAKNIGGKQRQIDLDLVEKLSMSKSFLARIDQERKLEFCKIFSDEDVEEDDYKTYNFEMDKEIMDGELYTDLLPEYVNTRMSKQAREILRDFKLPIHFYTWILSWLDKGHKPKYLPPIVDTTVFNKPENLYKVARSGLATTTSKELKKLFKYLIKINVPHKKNKKELLKQIRITSKKVSKNIYRPKRIQKEVLNYLKTENETYLANKNKSERDQTLIRYKKTSSYIAGETLDTLLGENEAVIIKRIANKLRKRKSYYRR